MIYLIFLHTSTVSTISPVSYSDINTTSLLLYNYSYYYFYNKICCFCYFQYQYCLSLYVKKFEFLSVSSIFNLFIPSSLTYHSVPILHFNSALFSFPLPPFNVCLFVFSSICIFACVFRYALLSVYIRF